MLSILTFFALIEAGLLIVAACRRAALAAALLGALLIATTAFAYILHQHWLTDAQGLQILKVAIPLFKLGAIIVVVPFLWLKKRRQKPGTVYLDAPPGAGWQQTGERFVEAGTNRVISVWFNPTTGERNYVRV
jgi:hypothetical protein